MGADIVILISTDVRHQVGRLRLLAHALADFSGRIERPIVAASDTESDQRQRLPDLATVHDRFISLQTPKHAPRASDYSTLDSLISKLPCKHHGGLLLLCCDLLAGNLATVKHFRYLHVHIDSALARRLDFRCSKTAVDHVERGRIKQEGKVLFNKLIWLATTTAWSAVRSLLCKRQSQGMFP